MDRVAWRSKIIPCVAAMMLVAPIAATALEERIDDLSASVEVAGVFGVDATQTALIFTNVSGGRTTVLGEGRFHNQVTCRSNYGRPWYLKAQLVELRHTGTKRTLPPDSLKWKVVESSGVGRVSGRETDFQPFSDAPVLIYIGEGDDNLGRPVTLKFQYSLTPPPSTLAGTYIGQISFTMSENP